MPKQYDGYKVVPFSEGWQIVGGAPAARPTSQLKSLIESGYGLVGQEVVVNLP